MSLRLPLSQPRPWIYLWLALLVPAWAIGFWLSARMIHWTRTSVGLMCGGLDAYTAFSRLPAPVPGEPKIGFVTDVPDPASAERFFCAQYEAAPRVLVRLRAEGLETLGLAGRRLIVHIDDPAAPQGVMGGLAAAAGREGVPLRTESVAPGIVLVQAGGKAPG